MSYQIIPVKIGYSEENNGIERADATITLIKGPFNIIVDLGNPWDRDHIIEALRANSINTNDINTVICTHAHSDHIGNLNLFLNATFHLVGHELYYKDIFFPDPFEKYNEPLIIDEKISVISTPGHTDCDISVIIKDVSTYGTVVIAGDIFEKAEDLTDPSIWGNLSKNKDLQKLSREKILKIADTIIPGHGPMFTVPINAKRNYDT